MAKQKDYYKSSEGYYKSSVAPKNDLGVGVFPLRMGDIILAMIVFFVAAFLLILAYYLSNAFVAGTANMPVGSFFAKVFGSVNTALGIFSSGIILIFLVTCIASMVGAYFANTHRVFAVASLLFTFIIMIMANLFSNLFSAFISTSFFAGIGNVDVPLIVSFFQIFPIVCMAISFLWIFLQFGAPKNQLSL